MTYTLRIGLEDVEPEVWRRFTVPSDIMLDALHPVLQTVMGWQDEHQHCFISAPEKYSADSLRFDTRPRFDAPSEAGVNYEDTARLDEVLAGVGDLLFYQYNFRDGWEHTIVLEEVGPLEDRGAAVCVAGARKCPPENAGGAYGYTQVLEAFEAAAHFARQRNDGGPLPDLAPERFSAADVNRRLRRQSAARASYPAADSMAAGLLRLIPEPAAPQLYSLLDRAQFRDVENHGMTAQEVDAATYNLRWLLQHLGDDGLALTSAGYLRPADVVIAREALGWAGHPQRVSDREADCRELVDLRAAAASLGLTRTVKGRLRRTERGDAMLAEPGALLDHLAGRLPVGAEDIEQDSGLLFLFTLAGGAAPGRGPAAIAEAMTAMGWRTADEPVSPLHTARMAGPTVRLMRAIGAFGEPPALVAGTAEDAVWGPRWGRELARIALARPV